MTLQGGIGGRFKNKKRNMNCKEGKKFIIHRRKKGGAQKKEWALFTPQPLIKGRGDIARLHQRQGKEKVEAGGKRGKNLHLSSRGLD